MKNLPTVLCISASLLCTPYAFSTEKNSSLCSMLSGQSTDRNENNDIQSFKFCLANDPTPQVGFEIGLSDKFSDAGSIQVLYWLYNNEQHWVTVPRSIETELFELEQNLNQYTASGQYSIRALRAVDNAGSLLHLNENQINLLGFNTTYDYVNETADQTKPTVTSFNSSGWIINHEGQPTLSIELIVSDDLSGLNSDIIIELNSPTGSSLQERSVNNIDNSFVFKFVLSKYASSGDYAVKTIRVKDLAGNLTHSEKWISDNLTPYNLDNPNSDSSAPELNYVIVVPKFHEESDRPYITVSGNSQDNLAGASEAFVRMTRPNGGLLDNWLTVDADGSFEGDIFLPNIYENGLYKIKYIRLNDKAENQKYYYKTEIDESITSISSFRLFYPGEAEEVQSKITGSDQSDYIFGAHKSSDIISAQDGDDYIYTGAGEDTVDAGKGDDTVIAGSGQGDDDYNGDSGIDKIIYTSASAPIYIDFKNGIATGVDIGNDTLTNFEVVVAGKGNDVIETGNTFTYVQAYTGDDVIVSDIAGGQLTGGEGADEFVFNHIDKFTLSNHTTITDYTSEDSIVIDGQNGFSYISWTSSLQGTIEMLPHINKAYLTTDGTDSYIIVRNDIENLNSSFVVTLQNYTANNITIISQSSNDHDNDGIYDYFDEDDDNDGVPDLDDTFPLDDSESLDTDGDGIGNNADMDDDGDGVNDDVELANGSDPLDSQSFIGETTTLVATNDINGDGVSDWLQFAKPDGAIDISLLSGTDYTEIAQYSITHTFDVPQVVRLEDRDADGADEVGVFGFDSTANRYQLVVHASIDGDKFGAWNWPATLDEVSFQALADLTLDGQQEYAISGVHLSNGTRQLVVKDGATRGTHQTFKWPNLWDNTRFVTMSDVTRDGIPEVALYGRHKRLDKGQLFIYDGADSKSKVNVYNWNKLWSNIELVKMDDIDGDGTIDWGQFGQRKDDGRYQWLVKKGHDKRGVIRVFSWPSDLVDAKALLVGDRTADGIREVALFGTHPDTGKMFLRVNDGALANKRIANISWPANWEDIQVKELGDLNNDGFNEFALLGYTKKNRTVQLVIKDGKSATDYARYTLAGSWENLSLSHADVNDDGLVDVVISGINQTSEQREVTVLSGGDLSELTKATIH